MTNFECCCAIKGLTYTYLLTYHIIVRRSLPPRGIVLYKQHIIEAEVGRCDMNALRGDENSVIWSSLDIISMFPSRG